MDKSTSDSSSQVPFNINIVGSESTNSKGETISEFKDYIIQNNISLQKINKELTQKNNELSKELSDKEDELDKEEERLRYIKGLLNNLNEVRKLAILSNELKNEIYQKSLLLSRRVISIEHTIYNNLVFYSRITSGLLILSIIFNLYHRKNIINLVLVFYPVWIPPLLINIYYTYIEKQEPFNIFKKGHYKLYQDISVFRNFLEKQEQKIKEKMNELKEIEDSNLSLENWISEV